MYQPKYFKGYELVDQEVYSLLGEQSCRLIDEGLLKALDRLKEDLSKKIGKEVYITVNNWINGGSISQRGFRTGKSKTGGSTSQHRKGNAVDFIVSSFTAEEVRQHILDNKDRYPEIIRMEKGVSWVHIDCKVGYEDKRIYLFKP